jgi:hypothetical protein
LFLVAKVEKRGARMLWIYRLVMVTVLALGLAARYRKSVE